MHLMVLGGGLAGVTSAWYLRKAGFDVTVIDRQPDVALETSFANGGQISVSHPEPWANPGRPRRFCAGWVAPMLRCCFAPLRTLRSGAGGHPSWPSACLAGTTQHRSHCRAGELQSRLPARAAARDRSALPVSRDRHPASFHTRQACSALAKRASELEALAIGAEVCDAKRCLELEPALANAREDFCGGLYAADDESGDAHLFVRKLAEKSPAGRRAVRSRRQYPTHP